MGHVALCYDSCGQFQSKFTNVAELGQNISLQKHDFKLKVLTHRHLYD